MSEVFRTMIVPEPYATLAAVVAAAVSETAAGMFETPLAPRGGALPTHRISSGWGDAAVPATLQDAEAAHAACIAAGHYVQPAHCAAMSAAIDITEQDPHAAMARLGLELLAAEENA